MMVVEPALESGSAETKIIVGTLWSKPILWCLFQEIVKKVQRDFFIVIHENYGKFAVVLLFYCHFKEIN
jgi:hypothetical protein